jgi:hypothetical protein
MYYVLALVLFTQHYLYCFGDSKVLYINYVDNSKKYRTFGII